MSGWHDGLARRWAARWQGISNRLSGPVRPKPVTSNGDRQRPKAETARLDQLDPLFFDAPLVGMGILAPGTGRFIRSNARLREILGYSSDELLALTWSDVIPREDRETKSDLPERLALGENTTAVDNLRLVRRDGRTVTASLDARCSWRADNTPEFVIITVQDTTERAIAENAQRSAERFFRATVDALTAHIAILNEYGTIVAVNAAWRDFMKANSTGPTISPEGQNYISVCTGVSGQGDEDAARAAAGIRSVLSGQEQTFSFEYPCHSPEKLRWFSMTVSRFHGPGPVHVVVAHENVTDRRRAESALRDSETLYRFLAEHTADVIYTVDLVERRFIYVSPNVLPLLGYAPDELRQMAPTTLITDETRVTLQNQLPARLEKFQKEGEDSVTDLMELVRKDGTTLWTETRTRFVRSDNGGVIAISVSRDITERREADARLAAVKRAENERIGRELHDGLGAHLAGVRYVLDSIAVKAVEADKPDIAASVNTCCSLLEESINYIRSLARNFEAGEAPREPFADELRHFADTVGTLFGIQCEIEVDPLSSWNHGSSNGEVMQIIHEAVNNAVRHGHPKRIRIGADSSGIMIENDGRDFPDESSVSPGVGLASMRQRAQTLGCALEVNRRNGGGTVVRLGPFTPAPATLTPRGTKR